MVLNFCAKGFRLKACRISFLLAKMPSISVSTADVATATCKQLGGTACEYPRNTG